MAKTVEILLHPFGNIGLYEGNRLFVQGRGIGIGITKAHQSNTPQELITE
ncbi:MAG TPA: hypothetical protein VF939_04995 [Puia sp.]